MPAVQLIIRKAGYSDEKMKEDGHTIVSHFYTESGNNLTGIASHFAKQF